MLPTSTVSGIGRPCVFGFQKWGFLRNSVPHLCKQLNSVFCLVQKRMSCPTPSDRRHLIGSWDQDGFLFTLWGIEVFVLFCFFVLFLSFTLFQPQWVFTCAKYNSLLPFPSGLGGEGPSCNFMPFPQQYCSPSPGLTTEGGFFGFLPDFSPFSSNAWKFTEKSLQVGVNSSCICSFWVCFTLLLVHVCPFVICYNF